MNETTTSFVNTEYVFTIFQNKTSLKEFIQTQNSDLCMEYENAPVMSDTRCSMIIKEKLKIDYPSQIKTKGHDEMKQALRYLKKIGMNITQISRVTEIPRQIVALA